MMTGITDNYDLKNVKVTDDGAVKVSLGANATTESGALKVVIEESKVVEKPETTLKVAIVETGTEATNIEIGKQVTEIEIANYSETATVNLTIGSLEAIIGANLATSIPINKLVDNISLTATEEKTQVQIIVKGVEE